MATVELTCICCPMGCPLTVEAAPDGEVLSVAGQSCRRGADYGRREATAPERMLTYVVPVQGRLEPLSVKTAQPVSKALMADVVQQLRQLEVQPPVEEGDVVLENVAATGIPVIATKTIW
ncbi:DUF1667 domain-containing protein [Parvibacter caecicola]|uniref:CxxC motif-containing protein n=1 Tax=Parvibacter caecicola TaxID=747645 RepID=A0A3N0AAV0_9ACTN|nr:DUF1667 domain-containing protein [Parvibacter caecicola]MBB3171250.1 CxxC motif-containing protein [Parvibacter caecicola]MCR2041960.1 DUF1667 domain-containing protein [Parvibacter caecicola]RNL09795.1 hypothetical protein DMP11_07995 [Parvibacter caecicola]TJW11379.1 DUF1667 domain-containing protein [Parvibacter caecicola]